MKNRINFRIISLLFMIPLFIYAASFDGLTELATAFKKSDSKTIASYFDTMIEIKISDKEGTYSKSQGEQILKDFFEKNNVIDFHFKHDGASGANNAQYAIGSISTSSGKFRTYIYMKKKGDTFVIQELTIENE